LQCDYCLLCFDNYLFLTHGREKANDNEKKRPDIHVKAHRRQWSVAEMLSGAAALLAVPTNLTSYIVFQ
jgi:hypothetical protein